jgi:catechol 2,3-dioxygenase-like lactoylglutathione lyase family enzyme
MFIGTHILLYSADPAADRAFLSEVLGFKFVDTGDGWLIFKMPAAELGVHPIGGTNLPSAARDKAQAPDTGFMVATIWLMVADVAAAHHQLADKGVECPEPHNEGWGIATSFMLPGGGRLGLYQPIHETALGL